MSARTVIFGVDGLTLRVLHPLMDRGRLPNFQRLRQHGCEAVLESKYPPATPSAWMSLATGLKPAGHGVYDFWDFEEQDGPGSARRAKLQTRRKGGKAIWNILSEYGKKVLVLNIPMTYPPEPVNGIMISGYMTPSAEADFTYPQSFKEELFRAVPDYMIDLNPEDKSVLGLSKWQARVIDATLRMTEQRIKLIDFMLKEKPWDFCFLGFVGADRLQHRLWDEITSLEARATAYYDLLDDGLGHVLDLLGPGDSLFVVSDHGFQGASRSFEPNEYLYRKGLVALGVHAQENRARAGRVNTLKHALRRAGLFDLARRGKAALEDAGWRRTPATDAHGTAGPDIIWERTLAYIPSTVCFGAGYADIFLSPHLDAECLSELVEDLQRQVDPLTGKTLVEAAYTAEVFGGGPYAPREPHLLLLPNEGITFRHSFGNKRLWGGATMANAPLKKSGVHHKDGVLYAYGGIFKRGFAAPNAEVYDLVPTLLASMGLPLPLAFDGRVLEELFAGAERPQRTASGAESGPGGGLARRKLQRLLEVEGSSTS
jgi:predicted AlkP superfamily phosphohydrolase/phosphomutase